MIPIEVMDVAARGERAIRMEALDNPWNSDTVVAYYAG